MHVPNPNLYEVVEAPVKLATAPYICPQFAQDEKANLWLKV